MTGITVPLYHYQIRKNLNTLRPPRFPFTLESVHILIGSLEWPLLDSGGGLSREVTLCTITHLCMKSHLLQFLALLETWHAFLDQEEGDAVSSGLCLGIGDGHHNRTVRMPTVRNEYLATIQDPIITVLVSIRLHTLKVTEISVIMLNMDYSGLSNGRECISFHH